MLKLPPIGPLLNTYSKASKLGQSCNVCCIYIIPYIRKGQMAIDVERRKMTPRRARGEIF